MNYYGRILRADLIDARAPPKPCAPHLPWTGRKVASRHPRLDRPHGHYSIRSAGDIAGFKGRETIHCGGVLAYELDYHGGLVKP